MSRPAQATAAPRGEDGTGLGWWRMLVFSLPAGPHAFIVMPLMVVLPGFYASNTAVTTAQVALVISLGRVFDAVIDPFLGHMSDRTPGRLGPRKPWLISATLICPLAIFFLYQPPRDAGFVYFTAWSFLLYVGTSMFEIGRGAWSAELTRDYTERSQVSMVTAFFNICGSLSFWLLPLLLAKTAGTTAITGGTLSALSWIYLFVMPPLMLLSVWLVPVGVPQIAEASLSAWRAMLSSLRLCRPLWHYLAAISCWGLGQGTFMTVLYVFMTDYMQLGEKFPVMMLSYFVIQLLVMPVWGRILRRVDRHRAWAVSLAVDCCSRLLILLLPVGPEAFVPAFAVVAISATFATPCNFLPPALLADVVDYNTLKVRSNQAARFYALNSLAIKIMQALGGGLAFACLAAADYQIGKPNPPEAAWGLLVAYLGIPTVLLLAAAVLAWRFPLDRVSQRTIRRRLERLATRTA
ncbi:MFS transporter [Rubrivivax albus]|uniref:MFS transporter n=1 Tax=Rubrivivax albus TaxID=2499835 RepID=A0A3S2U8K1_9BURK|nr:MFS transporter [Rubrivivax albus]RVT51282.1 MFS transporter [Rubrivivax albus]